MPHRGSPLFRGSQRRKSARWRRSACPGPGPHSVGRRERYKGHQRVVEALPIVKQTIPHATLRIYGAGPYEPELRASIGFLGVEQSAEVQFIAPDNRARVAAVLCEAEVFAALSEYEAHPVAVMEALTLGIPTVGLDTTGLADLVSDGLVTGIPKDASPTTVAQVLVEVLAEGGRSLPRRCPAGTMRRRRWRVSTPTWPRPGQRPPARPMHGRKLVRVINPRHRARMAPGGSPDARYCRHGSGHRVEAMSGRIRSVVSRQLTNPLSRGGLALFVNTAVTAVLGFAYWIIAARLLPPMLLASPAPWSRPPRCSPALGSSTCPAC